MDRDAIFSINSERTFERMALETFRYQYAEVDVYREYVDLLRVDPLRVDTIDRIPFLPIELFKTRSIIARGKSHQAIFTSSGTTGNQTSRHFVAELSLYTESFSRGFSFFYGVPSDYTILALLPSYLERKGSSLVYMAEHLIRMTGKTDSGFYLNQYDELARLLTRLDAQGQRILLLGVSFALLELAERFSFNLNSTIVMETGGMKGRRNEITRTELHSALTEAFGVDAIHSEYGMTELLSQAYSAGKGIFRTPPWMRVIIRDQHDPFARVPYGTSGGINVIDLANRYSCAFIQTEDLGRSFADGSFEVLGRMNTAPLRGCNLLIYE